MILEYLPGGDLLGYLRKTRGHVDSYNTGKFVPKSSLSEKELLSFAWMVAEGMTFLSSHKVNHFVTQTSVFFSVRLPIDLVFIDLSTCQHTYPPHQFICPSVCPFVIQLDDLLIRLFFFLFPFVHMSSLSAYMFFHSSACMNVCPHYDRLFVHERPTQPLGV